MRIKDITIKEGLEHCKVIVKDRCDGICSIFTGMFEYHNGVIRPLDGNEYHTDDKYIDYKYYPEENIIVATR